MRISPWRIGQLVMPANTSSGSNGRDWPLTAIPPTPTTQTRVLSNGHAASQIDIFFSLEGTITFPTSHRRPCSFNVRLRTIVFVGHVIPPWRGSSVDDPTGRADAVLASCPSAAPLCSPQSRSLLGLAGHNDLEVYDLSLYAFSKTYLKGMPGTGLLSIARGLPPAAEVRFDMIRARDIVLFTLRETGRFTYRAV